MINTKRKIRVRDSKGFHYEVTVDHAPHLGFSTAYYMGRVIAQVDEGKLSKPYSDDDREWEKYEESLVTYMEKAEIDIIPGCVKYFDEKE